MTADKKPSVRPTYVCPYANCKRVFDRHNVYRQHISIALACPDEAHKLDTPNAMSISKKPRTTAREQSQKYKASHPDKVKAARDEYNPRRLDVIVNLSKSLHETLATRHQAAEIVYILRSRSAEGVHRRKDYQTVDIPSDTTIRLVIDVLRLCKIDRQPPQSHDITSGTKSEQDLSRCIAALFALERDPGTNTTASPAHATSIWSIPATADGLQNWTSMIRDQLVIANPSLVIDTVYSTTVSPAGMFSTWHIDQTWGGTVLVGLDHPKLFVMCPPTERNLEVYDEIDEFGNINLSMRALSKFEELSYIVLIKGDVYILPAGFIHMVLSMRNSAVGGWACFKAEWADIATKLTMRDIARFVEEEKTLLNDEKALVTNQNEFKCLAEKGEPGSNTSKRRKGAKVKLDAGKRKLQAARVKLQAERLELEANWTKAENVYAALRQK